MNRDTYLMIAIALALAAITYTYADLKNTKDIVAQCQEFNSKIVHLLNTEPPSVKVEEQEKSTQKNDENSQA